MIENYSPFVVAIAASAALACSDRGERASSELQGVVELDERPLGFELPGSLREVPARRGQAVKAGQVLAVIDDGLERPQRDAREADLRHAQSQLELLQSGARREDIQAAAAQVRAAKAVEGAANDAAVRARKLHAAQTIATAQLDEAESQLKRATAEREAAEERHTMLRKGSRAQEIAAASARVDAAAAALALSEARLSRMKLHAPIDGVILDVHTEPGQIVGAGMPVVTLGDTAHPYVDVFVPQGELRGVRVGLAAQIRVDGEPQPFAGKVEDVARKTEFTPRYLFSPKERPNLVVRVRVRVDDPQGRLHAGVPARAQFDRAPFREGT